MSVEQLPQAGRAIEVWTNAVTRTQRFGVTFDKEPSWVPCYVRSVERAFDYSVVVEQDSRMSFAVSKTTRWRYTDE